MARPLARLGFRPLLLTRPLAGPSGGGRAMLGSVGQDWSLGKHDSVGHLVRRSPAGFPAPATLRATLRPSGCSRMTSSIVERQGSCSRPRMRFARIEVLLGADVEAATVELEGGEGAPFEEDAESVDGFDFPFGAGDVRHGWGVA